MIIFDVLGETWGRGDGSKTFNLPDFRGRTLIGSGNGGTGFTNRTLAQKGGAETHTLSVDQMPKHRHITHYDPAVNGFYLSTTSTRYSGGGGDSLGGSKDKNKTNMFTSYQGKTKAHNNMQPFAVVKYIIKY